MSGLMRLALAGAMKKPAPNRIPLSGIKRLRERDYYQVSLIRGKDRMLVGSVEPKGVTGLLFVDETDGREASLPNSCLQDFSLEIIHYFDELELGYTCPLKFVLFRWVRSRWQLVKLRISVWSFARLTLPRDDRMEMLQWAYEWTLDREAYEPEFGVISFLFNKHGALFSRHPDKGHLTRHYKLVSDSLVNSGDLREKSLGSYCLAPQGLATLDKFAEATIRHNDNLRTQRAMIRVSLALVFVGLLQASVTAYGAFWPPITASPPPATTPAPLLTAPLPR